MSSAPQPGGHDDHRYRHKQDGKNGPYRKAAAPGHEGSEHHPSLHRSRNPRQDQTARPPRAKALSVRQFPTPGRKTVRTSKLILSLASAGAIAIGVAACGSSSSSSSATPPSAKPVATLTNLTGTSTSVKLDPSFLGALKTLGLAPGTIGTATLNASTGVISFPITGGSATYYTPGTRTPYVESTIMHDGSGLSLTAGSKTVQLTNFVVDAGTSKLMGDVSLNGTSVAKGAYLFFLDGTTLQPLDTTSEPGHGLLTGTEVKISPDAATLLDSTFGTNGVTAYLPVGVATIDLKLPATS
jgi:hypothetical protein